MLKSVFSLITFLTTLDFSMNFLTQTKVAESFGRKPTQPSHRTLNSNLGGKRRRGSSKLAKMACYVGYTGHDNRL